MPNNVDTSFIKEYETAVHNAFQRQGSKLRTTVRWNRNDPNRDKLLALAPGDPVFDMCLRIARRAVRGAIEDRTRGAAHYHTRGVNPAWAVGRAPSAEIGAHLFYNDVE